MTMLNKQGVLMDKWFKSPNAIIDDITGDVVSPQAAIILCSILRLTEGIRGRNWASIPHSFFMRKTRTKRRETIGKYIDELVDNELINVNKSNGKVTEYAINWRSKLWYSLPELEQKTASTVPVRFISTSTFQPYIPVRFIRTGSWQTSTFHPYTYKDIVIKDNIKEKKKEKPKPKFDALTYPIPSFIKQENWNDFVAMRKEIKKPLTETAAKRLISKLTEFDANGFDANESLDYSIMGQYQGVFERNRKQQSNNQVNGNERHNTANHSNQPNHFDSLRAEIAAKYGTSEQPRDIRTVSETFGDDDRYV